MSTDTEIRDLDIESILPLGVILIDCRLGATELCTFC